MATVAAAASRERPSWLAERLDARPHLRLGVVVSAIALAVVGSLAFGIWGGERLFVVDTNLYVASAGLFIVALAIERMTELLIAPWVGGGDRRTDRNILVGCWSLLIGVLVSGLLGLRLLALLRGGDPEDVGWLGTSVEVFATGLAIGAGAKPLHDLISRFEKNVQATKDAAATADAPPPPRPDPAVGRAPAGGAYRLAVAVKTAGGTTAGAAESVSRTSPGASERSSWAQVTTLPTVPQLRSSVATLLPGWMTSAQPEAPGSALVHAVTAAVPGSTAYVREVFSAAHRLHGAGLDVNVAPTVVQDGTTSAVPGPPRAALERLGVDATVQQAGHGGRGIRIAVLDTGWHEHPDGVGRERVTFIPGADVVGGGPAPIDPLLPGADLFGGFDVEVMGTPGHGTGVAAVMAAGGRTDLERYSATWWEQSPMIGVAPEAEIVPIRVMRGPVHLLDDEVARGVDLAVAAGCDVISMSLGGLAFRGLDRAIEAALAKGIIVVAAAGNEVAVVVEPACYATTIAVAGARLDGQPYLEGSSRGPEVTISAPGVDIVRPDFEFGDPPVPLLEPGVGTTYATAHVAGLAALWLAHHGADHLRAAYQGHTLQRAFAHVLGSTARPWPADRPELAVDWGPGTADGRALLERPVLGDGRIDDRVLDGVFGSKTPLAATDRVAGAIGGVLAADGGADLRANLFGALVGLRTKVADRAEVGDAMRRRQDDDTKQALAENAAALVRAELQAQAGANPNYRRALASAGDEVPVPVDATPELRLVLDASNATTKAVVAESGTWTEDRRGREWEAKWTAEWNARFDEEWGVAYSRPLKLALQGAGTMQKGYRRVGVAALGAAVVIAALFAWIDGPEGTPGAGALAGSVGGAIGLLGIGLYGGAQAIERVLEFTVGRWAFKDTPGREMDRALIMLGCGILVGCLVAVLLDAGLLGQVASGDPADSWFHGADILITGLAIGGGAKPLHDLLTWIRLPKPP